MEKIVYILGAGFSAPLGLPVMSNFYHKSQDMFYNDPTAYPNFSSIFETVTKISYAGNYYDTNVFNIEDVLSILEMNSYVKEHQFDQHFKDYIIKVIEKHTPNYAEAPFVFNGVNVPNNIISQFYGPDDICRNYFIFVCNLLGISFDGQGSSYPNQSNLILTLDSHLTIEYSVVSLNYDLVLENIPKRINKHMPNRNLINIGFGRDGNDTSIKVQNNQYRRTPLAKLHGSVDSGEIVPPTWSKGINTKVSSDWAMAQLALSEATQIRIIGYSLPIADAYIKYLLKSASIDGPKRLRKIDVICWDSDGSVQERYKSFVKFPYFDFVNEKVDSYLALLFENTSQTFNQHDKFPFDDLERSHIAFMRGVRPRRP